MRVKRISTKSSSSSSDDEVLSVLKQKKEKKENPNSYNSLCREHWEQCEFCDEVFSNRYTLIQHNVTHMLIPLIKQTTHQCKHCLQHFVSEYKLDMHKRNYHNVHKNSYITVNLKEKMPDILKSIVEKQVLIKCVDDINMLVNRVNCKSKLKIGSETHNDNIESQNNVPNKQNVMKEEPLSPTYTEEQVSSAIDDESKESIRQRLLFEEDIEDSLFRDISNECNVNIETLCQEMSLDFGDAVLVSDDEEMSSEHNNQIVNSGDGVIKPEMVINNFNHGMNNENGVNSFGYETQNFENEWNSFKIGNIEIHNFANRNGFKNETNGSGNEINYLSYLANNSINELKNIVNVMCNSNDGMNNVNYGNNSNDVEHLELNEHAINESVERKKELIYVKAIHYNKLIAPKNWNCKYCGKEFLNRFELLQHKLIHLKVKKKASLIPLCCICERYIAGNHMTLRKHIIDKHPEYTDPTVTYKTYCCPKCNLQYYSYSKHLKNHHGQYKCEKCLQRFDSLKSRDECCERKDKTAHSKSLKNLKSYVTMQLCDLCFSFMKIYMKNRQNYEVIGTKNKFGVRQTCDKCNKEFFSVKLIKKYGRVVDLRPLIGVKAIVQGPEASDCNKSKMKPSKPLSNKERLVKIHNRLKMMKLVNKL